MRLKGHQRLLFFTVQKKIRKTLFRCTTGGTTDVVKNFYTYSKLTRKKFDKISSLNQLESRLFFTDEEATFH